MVTNYILNAMIIRACLTTSALLSSQQAAAFFSAPCRRTITCSRSGSIIIKTTAVDAKKRVIPSSEDSSWYDDVGDDASPEEVFWQEMERRRLISQSGVGPSLGESYVSPIDMVGKMDDTAKRIVSRTSGKSNNNSNVSGGDSSSPASSMASTIASQQQQSLMMETDFLGSNSQNSMSMKNPGITIAEERTAEATLASYAAFAVEDNYLYDDDDDDYKSGLSRNDPTLWQGEDPSLEEENAELDKQLDEWERELMGDGVDGSVLGGSSPFFDRKLFFCRFVMDGKGVFGLVAYSPK